MQDKRQETFLAEQKDFVRALDLLVWATRRTVLLRALIYSSNKRDAAFKAAALTTRANTEFANWLLAKTRKRVSIRRLLWRVGFAGQARLCTNLMREWATGEKATSSNRRSNAFFTSLASAIKLRSTVFPNRFNIECRCRPTGKTSWLWCMKHHERARPSLAGILRTACLKSTTFLL